MMNFIFILSQENIRLSKSEAIYSLGLETFKFYNPNMLVAETFSKKYQRLAYLKEAYRIISVGNSLEKIFDNINLNRYYRGDYKLEMYGFFDSRAFSKVWNSLKKPRVKLKKPSTLFKIFKLEKNFFLTIKSYENQEDFNSRKSHNRPFNSPISLNPMLARAMINLSGAERLFVDFFCGTGGILIEGGLMGLRLIGYDIDRAMVKASKKNLRFFGIKVFRLYEKNFFDVNKTYNYIVSDLPYGLNTKKVPKDFYDRVFLKLSFLLRKKAVIGLPGDANPKIPSNIKIVASLKHYIHRSLEKKILLLEKNKS
jgi:tRNA (guanine10-N2)-dimethyltransferase